MYKSFNLQIVEFLGAWLCGRREGRDGGGGVAEQLLSGHLVVVFGNRFRWPHRWLAKRGKKGKRCG